MFKDKELIEEVERLRKHVYTVDSKYHKVIEALKEHFKINLITEDVILIEWNPFGLFDPGFKYVGEKYKVVPLKKEKKTIKKKNKKSKK